MATYYKYAERDASNQVNWAEISSNMVNSLKEVQAIRDSKRKAIDDATAELGATLSEAPQGSHKGLNEFAMNYANNAQEMRLMQDKLLKSGQLKLKDYNIGRANLTQGTTQLFNIGKKYQAEYALKMDRFESGESGLQEQWQMAEIEGFANFSNVDAYINPTNGQISIGKLTTKTIDGKDVTTMDRKPGSFTTIDQLNFAVSDQVNKYNLDALDERIDKWAKTYLTSTDGYNSLDDVRQMPEYKKMKGDLIKSQMVDNRQVGSILADFVGVASNGEAFTFTRDPNKQDANTILLEADPNQPGSGRLTPNFDSKTGKEQEKVVEQFLDKEIERQLGKKQTKKAYPRPTATDKNIKKAEEQQGRSVELWNKMYGATQAEKKVIVNSLLSDPYLRDTVGLRDIDFIDDGQGNISMAVKYEDSTKNRTGENAILIQENKKPVSPDIWSMSGIEIHSQTDEAKRMRGLENAKTNLNFKTGSIRARRDEKEIEKEVDPVLSRDVFLKNYKVKDDDGEDIKLSEFQGDDVKFVKLFSPLFNEIGLTIDKTDFFSNTVQIKGPDGKPLAKLPTNDDNSGNLISNFLKAYLKNVEKGVLSELLSQGVIPKIAKGQTKKQNGDGDEPTPTLPQQTGPDYRGL